LIEVSITEVTQFLEGLGSTSGVGTREALAGISLANLRGSLDSIVLASSAEPNAPAVQTANTSAAGSKPAVFDVDPLLLKMMRDPK